MQVCSNNHVHTTSKFILMVPAKFFFFVALTSSLLFISASSFAVGDHGVNVPSAPESKNATLTPSNDKKVNLTLYYESLNPDAALFLVKDLKGVFDNNLIDIVNLRLVPWGKARTNLSNNAILCQNGPDECYLNTIQACAIDVWRVVDKHFGFIYCIEFLVIEGKHREWQSAWQECSSTLGLPEKPIMDCYNSGNGKRLRNLNPE
ncbi:gamma-interferon-responsive lysosomal thiol protein-like [Argentina anserina]|uniref:gamma-interferon-responsive lysosomal thiol protein-like n=1 Tax=Argentina anserina TaxID=57926 RepID=UPI0021766B25|nr:gamma-interferon-responsive lysosomal thiol protein-like [Potentilla anserina]